MVADEIDTVRRFNRAYTQRVGALDASFLGSGLPLGAARLLFEVGLRGATVRDLRDRLDIDSGYLSRLLRDLEHQSLVTVAPDPADGRRRVVSLTTAGRRRWRALDRRSDDVAQRLLAQLSTRQRTELVAALATAHRLVRIATATFDTVDPRAPAAVAALRAYFDELDARFPDGFDPADAITGDADGFVAPRGAFVLARADDDTLGCGALTRIDATTMEIKRMWIAPDWRNAGIGRRLLTTLEALAKRSRCRRVVLDTNTTLREAISMYRSAGYHEIERYNDNPYARLWFAKNME